MTLQFISESMGASGASGGSLPAGTEGDVLRYSASRGRWETAPTVLQVREDGVDLGLSDDLDHNIQGRTTVFGDPDDVVFSLLGWGAADRLSVLDLFRVGGGQYQGAGGYPGSYPGVPYQGSYPAGGDLAYGTGTTIDRRGARFDAPPLFDGRLGFTWRKYAPGDADDGQYYHIRPTIDAATGAITGWTTEGPFATEPNVAPNLT